MQCSPDAGKLDRRSRKRFIELRHIDVVYEAVLQ
jgi:hypothetical protein